MGVTPLITTIILTYRRPRLLKRAISSVLEQTYSNFQLCIYDNASGDETSEVVAELARQDSRVKYYCQPKNIGAQANFQFGLTRVQTPYFSFLSDDDFLLPEFYEIALAGFKKYPDVAFSAGSVITMMDDGKVLYAPLTLWQREGYFSPPEGMLETIGKKYPIWTGILFSKSAIDSVGLLDPETGANDLDFVYRITAHHAFVISKRPCAVCVSHASSSSRLPKVNNIWPGWLKMIRNITEDSHIPEDIRHVFEKRVLVELKRMIFWIGIKSIEIGNYGQAKEAATILRNNLKWRAHGHSVATLARTCERSVLIRRFFVLCLDVTRTALSLVRRDRVHLQREYGHLSSRLR